MCAEVPSPLLRSQLEEVSSALDFAAAVLDDSTSTGSSSQDLVCLRADVADCLARANCLLAPASSLSSLSEAVRVS